MPRGRKKKEVVESPKVEEKVIVRVKPEIENKDFELKKMEVNGEVVHEQPKAPEAAQAPVLKAEKPSDPWAAAVAESRKLLDVPLQKGQAYFESPEGFIMIDEETRGRVWCRQADKGRGQWINPRRI